MLLKRLKNIENSDVDDVEKSGDCQRAIKKVQIQAVSAIVDPINLQCLNSSTAS